MMRVLYECDRFRVTNGFFTGLRVVDAHTQSKIKAPQDVAHKALATWVKLQKARHHSRIAKRRSEALLFEDFGKAAISGWTEETMLFLSYSPEMLAEDYFSRAAIWAMVRESDE